MAKHEFPNRTLEIVSKVGFITKELWRDHVFGAAPTSVADKRRYHWAWNSLRERGYLRAHPNPRLFNVFILNRNDIETFKSRFGVAAACPYDNQLFHDEELLRGIFKIENAGLIRHWVFEAELKFKDMKEFSLSSSGKHLKYPDVILYLKTGMFDKLAIELELTLKSRRRYEQIIGAYGFLKMPFVLFVTATPSIEAAIKEKIEDNQSASSSGRFGFMSFADWQKNPVAGGVEWDGERTTLEKIAAS